MKDELKQLKEFMEELTGLNFEKQYQESKKGLELPEYIEVEYNDGTKVIIRDEKKKKES